MGGTKVEVRSQFLRTGSYWMSKEVDQYFFLRHLRPSGEPNASASC